MGAESTWAEIAQVQQAFAFETHRLKITASYRYGGLMPAETSLTRRRVKVQVKLGSRVKVRVRIESRSKSGSVSGSNSESGSKMVSSMGN